MTNKLDTLAGVAQWLQNEADVVARIRPCASKRYRQMASTCEAAQREIERLRVRANDWRMRAILAEQHNILAQFAGEEPTDGR